MNSSKFIPIEKSLISLLFFLLLVSCKKDFIKERTSDSLSKKELYNNFELAYPSCFGKWESIVINGDTL